MQSNSDIVRAYYRAVDQGELKQAGQLLAENFERWGLADGRMGKQETLDVLRRLQEAMPNYKHTLSNITAEADRVRLTVQTGGRHTQPLDLSQLGLGVRTGIAPASGRVITFEAMELEFTVVNGLIVAEDNVTPAKVFQGAPGFLQALNSGTRGVSGRRRSSLGSKNSRKTAIKAKTQKPKPHVQKAAQPKTHLTAHKPV